MPIRTITFLLFLSLSSLSLFAQTYTGQVYNKTLSRTEPGVVVTLVHHGQTDATVIRDTTDQQGRFHIHSPAIDSAQMPPLLSAQYGGVDYHHHQTTSDTPIDLPVYETTASDTAITLISHHIVLEARTGEVTQILIIQNEGDRTYRTGGDHGHGLEIPLPEGVTQLTQGPQGLHTHGNILVDPRPLTPGGGQLVFSFNLPASGQMIQQIKYPTGSVDLLILPADTTIAVTGLQDQGTATLGEKTFRRFSAAGLVSGNRFSIKLISTAAESSFSRDNLVWILASLALVFALLAFFYRPRKPVLTPTSDNRRTVLLEQIADLDERFENSILTQETYQVRRDVLKAEVADLTRSQTRQTLLEQIADLDDQFENGTLTEDTYRSRRDALKAEVADLTPPQS